MNNFDRDVNQLVAHYESKSLLGSLWGATRALAQLLFMGVAMLLPIAGGELYLLVKRISKSTETRSKSGSTGSTGARPNFFDES